AYSNEATETTFPNPPAAPSDLGAGATSAVAIRLTWTDRSDNEEGFAIERKSGISSYSEIARTEGGAVQYGDADLSPATTYTFRIRSFNRGGYSRYAAGASATTLPTPPPAPD